MDSLSFYAAFFHHQALHVHWNAMSSQPQAQKFYYSKQLIIVHLAEISWNHNAKYLMNPHETIRTVSSKTLCHNPTPSNPSRYPSKYTKTPIPNVLGLNRLYQHRPQTVFQFMNPKDSNARSSVESRDFDLLHNGPSCSFDTQNLQGQSRLNKIQEDGGRINQATKCN